MNKSLLTATRMGTLLACPRRHFWRFEIGLQPVTKGEALRFGSAWHRAMEARWRGADYDGALAAALGLGMGSEHRTSNAELRTSNAEGEKHLTFNAQHSTFNEDGRQEAGVGSGEPKSGSPLTLPSPPMGERVLELNALQCATVAGLLAGYYRHYAAGEVVKEIHPEIEFKHGLEGSRSFEAAGKIDGLGVLHDGRIALIEHKTCGEDISADSEYWLRLRANQQVMQYVLAARALGWDVQQVIYDVARKPAIRQKQNESVDQFGDRLAADCGVRPEFYFARREVPILEQDLEEFKTQRLVMARNILSCRAAEKRLIRREQAWPRNVNGMVCGNCEFSSFCLQNININTNQPPAGFQIGPANPELEQQV